MKLLLIRHGKAEDQDEFAKTGKPDEKRPLTEDGREEMEVIARGLKSLVDEIDVLATSPLTRARQTADAVAEQYPDAARETTGVMEPDAKFGAFVDWIRQYEDRELVAAVGHNTHISDLAAWLTDADEPIDMKKGSALLLELGDGARKGAAVQLWYMTPKQLRAAGGEDG